jgi:hypothetical protein
VVASFSLIGSVCFCCFGDVPTAFGGSREECRRLVLPPDVRENLTSAIFATALKLTLHTYNLFRRGTFGETKYRCATAPA